jgi:SAM-dependent methyltransferase
MKDKMNWHETIEYIRTCPEYKELVEKAYLEKDLPVNIERFRNSEEFAETLILLKKYVPNALSILDIGSGNGVSSISFALNGYDVVSTEPDPSNTIGAGAIRNLKEYYELKNIEIKESFAEDLCLENNTFDIVYARQVMHHAKDLIKFVKKATKGLKNGGIFFSVRDHVLYNHEEDEEWFLRSHPLQKFYGGESAYTEEEYVKAIENANLTICKVLKHYDSVINYFPLTKAEFFQRQLAYEKSTKRKLIKKLSVFSKSKMFKFLFNKYSNIYDESRIPGRLYSFIAIKK